jgi:hypothetical protein
MKSVKGFIPYLAEEKIKATRQDGTCACTQKASSEKDSDLHLFAFSPEDRDCSPKECWTLYTMNVDFENEPLADPAQYDTAWSICSELPCDSVGLLPLQLSVEELQGIKQNVDVWAIRYMEFLEKYKFDFFSAVIERAGLEDTQVKVPHTVISDAGSESNPTPPIPGKLGDACISRKSRSWKIPFTNRHWNTQASTCGEIEVVDDVLVPVLSSGEVVYRKTKMTGLNCYMKDSTDGTKPEDGGVGVCAIPARDPCHPAVTAVNGTYSSGGCRLGSQCREKAHSYHKFGYWKGMYCDKYD